MPMPKQTLPLTILLKSFSLKMDHQHLPWSRGINAGFIAADTPPTLSDIWPLVEALAT